MGDALQDALRTVVLFVPKFIAFLAILIIGIIIAKLIAKAIRALLDKVGFSRLIAKSGIDKWLAKSDFDGTEIVVKIIYYALVLFVLQLAFGVFGPNPISELITSVVAFIPLAIVAIVIVVIAAAIASAVRDLIMGALGGLSYGKILANIASAFIIALGIIAALNQVGIATAVTTPVLVTVLATIGGILVVGVGGGLIKPMQQRWEGYLQSMSREGAAIRNQVQSSSATQTPGVAGQPTRQAAPPRPAESSNDRRHDDQAWTAPSRDVSP